jgi:hypothetical protein
VIINEVQRGNAPGFWERMFWELVSEKFPLFVSGMGSGKRNGIVYYQPAQAVWGEIPIRDEGAIMRI